MDIIREQNKLITMQEELLNRIELYYLEEVPKDKEVQSIVYLEAKINRLKQRVSKEYKRIIGA